MDLHEDASAKATNEKDHGEQVSEVYFDRLPQLWPKVIISLRIIKDVNSCRSQEAKVDAAYDSELDRTVPIEEDILNYKPNQVLEKKDHLLELSVLLH